MNKRDEQLHIEPIAEHLEEVEIAQTTMAGALVELLLRIKITNAKELPVIA